MIFALQPVIKITYTTPSLLVTEATEVSKSEAKIAQDTSWLEVWF